MKYVLGNSTLSSLRHEDPAPGEYTGITEQRIFVRFPFENAENSEKGTLMKCDV